MRRLWANFERWLVGGALLATAGLVCVQILLRAAGKAVPSLTVSFSFTEEIAKTLLVWCTMLGAAAAVRERAHLGVVFLSRRLPGRLSRWVPVVGLAAMAVLFGLLAYAGIRYVGQGIRSGETSQAMRLPIWLTLRLAIPVGGGLVVVRCIEEAVRVVRGRAA